MSLLISSLSSKSLLQLKTLCKEKKLSPTGTKDELLKRLSPNENKSKKINKQVMDPTTLSQKEFKQLLDDYDDVYYNSSDKREPISDKEYDNLREIYEEMYGELNKIGTRGDRKEVKLECFMGSLDKKKTQKELDLWSKKYPNKKFYIDDKVDGVSVLFIKDAKGNIKLRKRGDGCNGSDISYLLPHIKFPTKVPNNTYIRMEFVMLKKTFNNKYKDRKSKSGGVTNARSIVAGLTNSKHYNIDEIKDITPIAYRIYKSKMTKSEQIKQLEKWGFDIPKGKIEKKLKADELQEYLTIREEETPYIIDGLVITSDDVFKDEEGENPEYAIAFKGLTESKTTTVLGIEWNATKEGKITPVVLLDPVVASESNLRRATGFNAKFIKDKGIGKGAIVEVIRSGGVIPKIIDVIKSVKPEFPDEEYVWDDNGVHILLKDMDDNRVDKKIIVYFFDKMNIKFVSEKTIEKLYVGGLDTIQKIIQASIDELQVEGIAKTGAKRIRENIDSGIKDCSLALVMKASGCFSEGIGEKKLDKVLGQYPDLLEWKCSDDEWKKRLKTVGIEKLYKVVINGVKRYKEWIKTVPEITIQSTDKESDEEDDEGTEQEKFNETIVFTGVRDKDLEKLITKRGGKITTSVSKNTTLLVVKEKGSCSGKELKAKDLDIKILTIDELRTMMNV